MRDLPFKAQLILIAACLPFTCSAGTAKKTKWILDWSDEFNGAAGARPDPAKWVYDLGSTGWGNQELEDYTDKPENVSIDGRGHLAIRAIRSDSGTYTSGRLKTKGRFAVQYGRIEARIRIPDGGRGIWPAFWMLGDDISEVGWPRSGEIDLMENRGDEPSIIHGTVHGPGYSGDKGISAQIGLGGGARFSRRFHVFGVEWSPGLIEFFLDGVPRAKVSPAILPAGTKWVFDKPFFLLLNLAVGGDWPGKPDSTTGFPQTMLVDWVRVWRAAGRSDVP
jgi:beta-glucanase (GH16 family)